MENLQKQAQEKYYYYNGNLFFKRKESRATYIAQPVGTLHHRGCLTTPFGGKVSFLVHRIIFLIHHGYLPIQVDHINGIKTDNRIENLRAANNAKNMWNKGKVFRNGTTPKSKYKGVTETATKKYMARVTKYGKRICLGTFDTEIEAAEAYNKKALELHGEFARLNVIN